jgi:hypothetical protein
MKPFDRCGYLLAVLTLCCAATMADAHGLLRRLFARARVVCEPSREYDGSPSNLPTPATLEGRVTLVGPVPKLRDLAAVFKDHPDAPHLFKAPSEQLLDPTWRIDPNTRGVANVCVYIKRPANGKLPILAEDKKRVDPVIMDAPFGVYVPHMVAVYPEWFDGNERGETGQKLILKNSSPVGHSHRAIGNPKYQDHLGRSFPPTAEATLKLKPQPLPVSVQCDIHTWMQAYVWVFDHPYCAITKEDGTFTIPRVPVGMDVQVMAWHESQGWLFTKEGKTLSLKQGKNVLDFTIKAP